MDITIIRAQNLFDSNCYLLGVADGFVLIDTSVARRRRALVEELRGAGCGPGDLRLVVLTHAHPDHACNCAYLRAVYDAPVAMHASDAGKAERGDMFWRPEGLTPAMKVARLMTWAAGIARFDPLVPDVLLEEGQRLDEHGLAATVLHLPGHSPGSICVLADTGALFCGDLITSTRGPRLNTIIDVAADYEASIERLRGLPVETVYPGHGGPFALDELG
jgi:glyoxylase-like metal-dependent hydrolase (beta-lactamase superfamily II)